MVEKQVLTTLVQYSTENEIKKKDGREKLKSFFPLHVPKYLNFI